jgi:putative ABC transport system substrate-binding protein
MRRREFISVLGGAAAAWPLAASAQQPVMPVIGFLSGSAPAGRAHLVNAFREGIRQSGHVEGQNVAIEYRWAQDQYEHLPDLAAELVRRQVTVIAATDTPSATATKAANTTIPIVFATGSDPVRSGLVASLNQPGSNLTGIYFMVNDLGPKQLGLLHELVPRAMRIAVLADPHWPITEAFISDVRAAASTIGKEIEIFHASTAREIDTVFASLAQKSPDALLVAPGALTNNRRVQLITSWARKTPYIVGMFMASTLIVSAMTESNALVVALMSFAFFGKGIAAGAGTWAVICDTAPKEAVGLAGSIFNCIGNIAGIVTPIVFGYIAGSGGYGAGLYFVGAHCIVAALIFLFVMGKIERVGEANAN